MIRRHPPRSLSRYIGKSVIVTTKKPDDRSTKGVVAEVFRDVIVLKAAIALEPGEQRVREIAMDGEAVIQRVDIALIQVPGS